MDGAERIAAERQRQIAAEGWTPAVDRDDPERIAFWRPTRYDRATLEAVAEAAILNELKANR